MLCKLLYVIQVQGFLLKYSTSWPYLISEFLVAYNHCVASDWPCTFLQPGCFYLAFTFTIRVISLSGSLLFLFRVAPVSLPSGLFTRISVTL